MSKLQFNSVEDSKTRRSERKDSITKQRSITPDTRKFDKTQFGQKLGLNILTSEKTPQQEVDVGTSLFKMPYSNGKQKVVRLGIDAETNEIKDFVNYFNSQTRNLYTLPKGKNSAQMSLKKEEIQKRIEANQNNITEIEKSIVETAKDLLNESQAVILDIFVRNDQGSIKLENNIPETHTVVLYKQESKYLVIDPSNASFSTILSGVKDVVCCFDKNVQIYKPDGKTDEHSWRDCIDIAVKLAFHLIISLPEIKHSDLKFKPEVLAELSAVKYTTNQQDLYPNLPQILEKAVVRAKQSSKLEEAKKATLYLKMFNKLYSTIEAKFLESGIDPIELQNGFSSLNQKKLGDKTLKHNEFNNTLKKYNGNLNEFIKKLGANHNMIEESEEKAIDLSGEFNEDFINDLN